MGSAGLGTAAEHRQIHEVPDIREPSLIAPQDAREASKLLFKQMNLIEKTAPEYNSIRNTLIEVNISLVHFAADKFRRQRPEEMEDIVQVGTIGLIKAIDRFELTREVEFASFATPYIVGEIRRFFRDCTWSVHVPRRLQEARLQLARATEELSRLGRAPTTDALSKMMNLPPKEVLEAHLAAKGYNSLSLDAAICGNGDGEIVLQDFIGVEEEALELVENLHALAPLIAELDQRVRAIIRMRFTEELTYSEIGERLGISQIHVSRLLKRALIHLRRAMLLTE
ncbi:SigB/SigF/SigG family RNA polymerase sigma factor [Streptomyces sp. NPDC048362]|uniref:SigB/SigF/SigG family RNA polymerase sigma factor n=1 Tax=Streptomyces sp. NPDC048362 TaxID=3365539 RepID=UPI00371252A0